MADIDLLTEDGDTLLLEDGDTLIAEESLAEITMVTAEQDAFVPGAAQQHAISSSNVSIP